MTVSSQTKQTLASLKGVQATLETFALHEEDPDSKELYRKNSLRLKQVVDSLEERIAVLELEEPQYKGF